jgi:hypothetical protein
VNTYLRLRLPGVLALTGGTLLACESAAYAIGAGPAHHTLIGELYSPVDGVRWLSTLNSHCLIIPWQQHALLHRPVVHHCTTPSRLILGINAKCAAIFAGGLVPFLGLRLTEGLVKQNKAKGRVFAAVRTEEGAPPPLAIELGTATGTLNKLGHNASVRKGQRVRLVDDDVSQDTLILGGKGSGKTVACVLPIMRQAFAQDCGALIFNVKGDVDTEALAIGRLTGRHVRVVGIGEGAEHVNLLSGVTPEMGAAYISAMLSLSGGQDRGATFWNATGTNLARGVLGLLKIIPARYSLAGLYRYLFIKSDREEVDNIIKEHQEWLQKKIPTLSGDERAKAQDERTYLRGCVQEIQNFGEQTNEIQSGAKTHLSMILAKMVGTEVEDAFCKPDEGDDAVFSFDSLYESGDIIVINCPLQNYGLAAAAVMAFAKLRFFVTMEQRRIKPGANLTRRVGLFIDEVQEIVTCSQEGMSDDKALAKSRDTGMFCVFATQSLSALHAKVGGDMMKAFIANLRQRIVFRTEDWDTIDTTLRVLGQHNAERISTSKTKQPGSWGSSKGESLSQHREAIADASLFRDLEPFHAVTLLSIGGRSADDVLRMTPVFV